MQTYAHTKNKVIGVLTALVILGCAASYVFADELSSTNFNFNDSGFTQLGGFSSTSNFQQFGTLQPVADGDSSSAHFNVSSGYLYPIEVSPLVTQNWRWYDDHTLGTPVVPLAGENVAPAAVAYDDPLKLRITVNDSGGAGVSNIKLRLQFATSSDFSEGAALVGEKGTCGSIVWCYDGTGNDNGLVQDGVLTDSQSCSGGLGNGCGTFNESGTTTSSFFHFPATRKEYDFTIKQQNAPQSTVYFFRLVDASTNAPLELNTGETYPSLTVDGGTLTFSIGGLTSGTSTEGTITDVSTSPTSVGFGTLSIGSPTIAAHRLTVSTNAGSGYKVYAFQRQGLLSASSREIAPFVATNDAPLGWNSGCTSTSTGCYGYHTGRDVLEGGSTRFAADDTYARFTASPTEVVYGSGPAYDETTDIVYKVEVNDSQDAGAYEGAIVYIVTPVF